MKKEKTTGKVNAKVKWIIAGVCIFTVIMGGTVWGILKISKTPQLEKKDFSQKDVGTTENVIVASGTTTTGMIAEELSLGSLKTELQVEEVYLHQGEKVEKNAKVLKITEDSLENARVELERNALQAQYDYVKKEISSETEKEDAELTYRQALIEARYSSNTYEDSIAQSAKAVSQLEKQLAEEEEKLTEYTEASQDPQYYYKYYEVEKLEKIKIENATLLNQKYDEWNIAEAGSGKMTSGMSQQSNSISFEKKSDKKEQNNNENSGSAPDAGQGTLPDGNMPSDGGSLNAPSGGDGAGTTGSDRPSGTGNSNFAPSDGVGKEDTEFGGGMGDFSQNQSMSGGMGGMTNGVTNSVSSVYAFFDEEVAEEIKEYEEALENAQNATRTLSANLMKTQANVTELEAELVNAKASYEETVLSAKLVMEQTNAKSELAESDYNTELDKINEELQKAQDALDEANDALTYFNTYLSDGYFYTSSGGEVMMVMARAGQSLTGDGFIMAYTDADSVSVEVSVDQSDIASVSVGEEVVVSFENNGYFDGTVKAINPVSQTGSKSSVYYSVTVALAGDVSQLSQNMTATVYIGMSKAAIEQPNGSPGGMNPPEGMELPGGMNPPTKTDKTKGTEAVGQ